MCLVCVSDVWLFGWIYGNWRKKAYLSKSTSFFYCHRSFLMIKPTKILKELPIFLINLFSLGFFFVWGMFICSDQEASNNLSFHYILFVVVAYQVIDSDKMSGNSISSMCMSSRIQDIPK